ncbi:MAG: NACHT domain-containing protein, partial [Actinomycetota bacterium]|nr:NACHT domain-containing protein [Actinomycetota bacterium]
MIQIIQVERDLDVNGTDSSQSAGVNEDDTDLDAFLKKARLSKYASAVRDVVGEEAIATDLLELEEIDIAGLCMKKIETVRFRRALNALRDNASSVDPASAPPPAEAPAASSRRAAPAAASFLDVDEERAAMDAALDFSALIQQKLADYFQGSRQWALDDLETWRTAPAGGSITLSSGETVEAGPMFWLKGGPGTGKTVWSAKVCELHQKDGIVAAHHFCRHSDAQTSDPRRMLRSIAAQLAHSVPGYAAGACDSDALEDLFQALIAEPLRQVPTPAAAAHRVILIDALDECEAGGKNALLDLVATKFGQAGVLPPWLRLVVTSRPDGDIVRKLARFRPVSMECDKNADDARAYLAHLLKHRVAEADVTAAVDLLLEKSEALFLYLDFVRARLAMVRPDAPATLDELDAFPAGLDGIYASEFRRVFGDG